MRGTTSRQSLHEDGPLHYEVELRELTYEDDGAGDLHVTSSSWRPVKVLRKDAAAMTLTFNALDAVQAYAGQTQPGAVRIVRVTDEGKRELVEAERA